MTHTVYVVLQFFVSVYGNIVGKSLVRAYAAKFVFMSVFCVFGFMNQSV